MMLYLLIKHAFLVVFMTCLIQFKYSATKSYAIIAGVNLVIWLESFAIYAVKGMDFLDHVYPLAISVPAFICFLLVSKSNALKVLFSFLTVCNFGMLKSYVGILSLNIYNSIVTSIIFETLFFAVILVLLLKVFQKPYFKILNTLDKGWGLLCSVPSILSIIIYQLLYYPSLTKNQPEYISLVLLVFLLMFVFYAIVYLNFENMSQYYQFKHDREIVLIQTEMQRKEYNALMEKINAIKIYRHDIRHHINAVNTFLNNNNITEARHYLRKMNENLDKTVVEQYCDNYVVNVILSSYISNAKNENIEVISKVDLTENIKIDDMELGLIFANAIENAIHACKKMKVSEGRKITIVCKEYHDQLYVQITNPFLGVIQFDGEYPVSSGKDHGIGTRSIAGITEKHGGVFSFTAQDGIFKTTVILNN